MKRFRKTDLSLGAGICVLLVGLTVAALTIRAAGAQRRHLAQKADTLVRLHALQADVSDDQRAVSAFERLENMKPKALADLLVGTPGAPRPEIRPRERRMLLPGWMLRQQEVNWPDCRLSDLAQLVARAESQQPPWRMVECTLTAAAQTPGVASATLLMETIEKQ